MGGRTVRATIRRLVMLCVAALLLSGCAGGNGAAEEFSPQERTETDNTIGASGESVQEAEHWTLEEKLWQLFFVTPEALTGGKTVTELSDSLLDGLDRCPVGGVILFARNVENRDQVSRLLGDLKAAFDTAPFLGVDEEGGLVTRLSEKCGVTDNGNMADVKTADEAREIGTRLGRELGELGFNMDFAPVADVLVNPDNTEIGKRSFGADPRDVAAKVAALVEGMQSAGVGATLKHFPGHGSAVTNSHDGTSVSQRNLEELRSTELLPFESGIAAGADFVMVSHLSLPKVTGDNRPASLSEYVITQLLRKELGYGGIVITDALNMGAATVYTADEAAVMAVEAGADMLLMPENLQAAYDGLLAAVKSGRITEERIDESVERILSLKRKMGLIP